MTNMSNEFNQQDVDAENARIQELIEQEEARHFRYSGLARYLKAYISSIINQRLKEGKRV